LAVGLEIAVKAAVAEIEIQTATAEPWARVSLTSA
jgi:hypothetical protein